MTDSSTEEVLFLTQWCTMGTDAVLTAVQQHLLILFKLGPMLMSCSGFACESGYNVEREIQEYAFKL